MSLMLKLLLSTLLLSSFLYADKDTKLVKDFLEDSIPYNKNIENIDINITDTIKIKELQDWKAYVVNIEAMMKGDKKKSFDVDFFSNGVVITKNLNMLLSGDRLIDMIKPSFKPNKNLLDSSLPTSKKVQEFLERSLVDNNNIENVEINVVDIIKVEQLNGWNAYVIDIKAILKKQKRKVKQKMFLFSDGEVITQELNMLKSGDSLLELIKPPFKDEYYKKENLIYGDVDAKHKVVIFSDPLCPFCRGFVPNAIKEMKKEPKKFAIYYYHFPLPSLHPAAVSLVKAAYAAELKGYKDVVLKLYNVKINSKERDVEKILKAFNETMGTDIKAKDLKSKAVLEHFENDLDVAESLMVGGTPTLFLDGKLDRTKKRYKKVK